MMAQEKLVATLPLISVLICGVLESVRMFENREVSVDVHSCNGRRLRSIMPTRSQNKANLQMKINVKDGFYAEHSVDC
jgi:hypothetical protein